MNRFFDRGRRALHGVGTWALCSLVVLAPLWAGGARADLRLILGAGALLVLALVAWGRGQDEDTRRGLWIPWPVWGFIALAGLYAFQLVPLPAGLLETLSPKAAAIRADLPIPAGGPASLDPPATWVALTLQLGFVATILAAANLSRARQIMALRAIAAAGALVAIVGLIHWVFDAKQIFGLYDAAHRDSLTGYFATFVNNNTLSGFAVFCAMVTVGLLARAEDHGPRQLILGALVLCLTAALLAGSRGGHVALVLGLVVFTVLAHLGRGADPWRQRARVVSYATMVVVLIGIALAVVMLPDWAETPFLDPQADGKVAAWGAALPYAQDFWLTGSGRDTFRFVYPTYQEVLVSGSISHPENIVLQLACEAGVLGIVLGIGGGLATMGVLMRGLAQRGSVTDWGLFAGLLAVGVQQLVDFGFEAAGLALPVAAGLGVGLARAARRSGPISRRPRLAPVVGVGALLAAVCLVILSPRVLDRQADRAVARIAHLAPSSAILADHPADYLLTLNAADAATRGGRWPEALTWLNRTFRRFPQGHQAHLIAARVFVATGRPSQAAVEYRLALDRAPWIAGILIREVVARLRAPEHLLTAAPTGPRGWRLLGNQLLKANRAADLRAAMERLEFTHPDDPQRRQLLGKACQVLGDAGCTTAQAEWLGAHGQPDQARALRALMAARQGDAGAALAALGTAGPLAGRSPDDLWLTAKVHARLRRIEAALAALDLLEQRTAADPARTAQVLAYRARVQANSGDREAALAQLIRAQALDPQPGYAVSAARQALALGRPEEARRLLDAAVERWPRSTRIAKARATLVP